MPGFLTDYTNNRTLDCFLGGVKIDPPSTLYFGLSLSKAFRGGYVVEPRAPSYARAGIANHSINFPPASGGKKTNAAKIVFPVALEYWGEVASVFISDAPTGGNVLAMADLSPARGIEPDPDHPPTIVADALFLSHH